MKSNVGLFLLSCIRLCVTEMYLLDDKIGLGGRFDGIGGLSGGGVGYLSACVHLPITFSFLHDLTVELRIKCILISNHLLLGYFETSNQL